MDAAFAMMDAMELDSILFPLNFVCCAEGDFGLQVLKRAKKKGLARMAIKSMAYSFWEDGDDRYCITWYKPVENRKLAADALRFTLSEDITAAIPPGDAKIFRKVMKLAADFTPLTSRERKALLSKAKGVQPIFEHPPAK